MDLFRQFCSFRKLMKDRLVAAFFFLGLVVIVVLFLKTLKAGLVMMGDSFFAGLGLFLSAFFQVLFWFVGLRLVCELMIAVFHINDNLAPEGGKNDTAELDPVEAARIAAAKAAKSASAATKTVVEKTRSRFVDRDEDEYPDYQDPTAKPHTRKTTTRKQATKKPATGKTASRSTGSRTGKKAAKKPAVKTTKK